MPNEPLSDIAIQRGLNSLPGWTRRGEAVTKTFQFQTFPAVISFVVRVAQLAEEIKHHPDIDIRYNKVTFSLSTHDAGGITQKDLDMANEIDFVQENLLSS